jgi:acetyl esterase/lipase
MIEGMKINRIFYGDNENHYGDLRIPPGNEPHPVAIVIHGGFWRARVGLDSMNRVANDLTSRGIATWNIEYRRVGQEGGGWPEHSLMWRKQLIAYMHWPNLTLQPGNTAKFSR